ncbi:MAG TPA: hypothetical protein VFC44_11795 [Candidatus Saccharimonadales bacterium]|nr:hypothetical protein [Candidatus Saccharimonadales bacterium]
MMSTMTPEQFEIFFLLVCAWAADQERDILRAGHALNKAQLADARKVGVAQAERVRLLKVGQIPFPTDPALTLVAKKMGFSSRDTIGRTLGYGILIRSDKMEDRSLVVHELVHTTQYERLGGLPGFLRPYLSECVFPPGYPNGPLEQEARAISKKVCARAAL